VFGYYQNLSRVSGAWMSAFGPRADLGAAGARPREPRPRRGASSCCVARTRANRR